ncbi:MAG: nucleoside deaminase [Chitinophagaceae bacterium]|jgi:tRNA(adenine34) deaminase
MLKLFICILSISIIPSLAFSQEVNDLKKYTRSKHEEYMRSAIDEAKKNESYPFGAVIVDIETGIILAKGVNQSSKNPTLHGEIVCMNNYVEKHGNKNWGKLVLYTTGEPCSMCMSALIWAGIGGVVYASSINGIKSSGIEQIAIKASQVKKSSKFTNPFLLGGILQNETDAMFLMRKK